MNRDFFRILLLCAGSAIALLGPSQPAAASIIFWTSNDGIHRANSDGSMAQQIITSTSVISDIVYQPVSGKIYWSELPAANQTVIKRAELDGSGAAEVVTLPQSVRQFSIDPGGGKLYWGASNGAQLLRSDFDGSNIEAIRNFSVVPEPAGVALDLIDGKVYWTQNFVGRLQRSNQDGSMGEDLALLLSPLHLALDHTLGKVYVTEQYPGNRISRANLDGTQLETVVTTGSFPYDIALDVPDGKVYWTQSFVGIRRVNLDGTAVETILSGADYFDIAIAPGTIVPEPSTLTLAALGLAAALLARRRVGLCFSR